MPTANKTVLWWGRFDPEYSRNRILRQAFGALGWQPREFRPSISALGAIEAALRCLPTPDLVFVPCFRQRDIAAARRFSRARGAPLMADPLISAYDKQVFERQKFSEQSPRARRLLRWERSLLQSADSVLADTPTHARFFSETLGVPESKIHVVPVGAEEALFTPAPHPPNDPIEVLFFGSFLALQGPEVIIDAARRYRGPRVRWCLVGKGPLLAECQRQAQGLAQVGFETWVPYAELPRRVQRADILLGVFGATPKAMRVIPNKIYQALACGKPVITCSAPAYPEGLLRSENSGIAWVRSDDPEALAAAVAALAAQSQRLAALGARAGSTYEKYFSTEIVKHELHTALSGMGIK